MSVVTHHALVIGAGPAGSSAAAHLARRGWRVTIAEAKRFPRVKVCGEYISPAAAGHLESLLPKSRLVALGARRVSELVIEVDGRSASWAMPGGGGDGGGAWVLSRGALDTALLEVARVAGAEVLQPVRVRAVEHEGDRVIASLDGGAVVEADIVVHADGHGRLDGSGAGKGARITPSRAGVVGQKCHMRMPSGLQVSGLRMRCSRGAYIGMVGVEDGMSTVALVARRAVVARFGGDADAMVGHLWRGYEAGWRCSPWLACGVAGSGYIAGSHERSFRIGNAAAAVEPVGGEGIGLALWAGAMLGGLLPGASGALDAAALAHARVGMARAYQARVRMRRPACRLAGELLMRPWLLRALWPGLALPGVRGALIGPWYALTGKPV